MQFHIREFFLRHMDGKEESARNTNWLYLSLAKTAALISQIL